MIEWLPTVLKGIGDAKVADVLREKVGLLELQRDTAIGERDVLATKLAQAKKQIETLEADKLDLQTWLDDLSQKPLAPFKVSDEYVFDTESGYWIHTDDYLRVCNDCLLPPTKIVSPLFEAVGSGMEYEDGSAFTSQFPRGSAFYVRRHYTQQPQDILWNKTNQKWP